MKKEVKRKLPGGWKLKKLGGKDGIAEIINGSTPSTDCPEYWDGNILWATPSDMGKLNSIYIEDTERKITQKGLESCSTKLLPIGTVLLTSRAPVGNIAITKKPLCTNQGFKSFIPKEGINKLYLYFALKQIIPSIQKQSHGNTFTEITKELVQDFQIPVPSTEDEQIKIAKEFERKTDEIEKMRQAALKQKDAISAMKGAILREVFPPKEGDKLPVGWRWEEVSNVCFLNPRMDRTVPRDANALTSFVPMDAIDEEKGVIAKIINRKYSEISKGYTFFANGDVLFAKITPCMQNGKSAIAENLIDSIGFGSTEFHVFRPREGTLKGWIYYFVRTSEFRKRAEGHFTGSAGQQRVPTDFLEEALIPMPPRIDEQIRIVAKLKQKVNELEKMSDVVDKKLEAMEAMQRAILRETFDFQEVNN